MIRSRKERKNLPPDFDLPYPDEIIAMACHCLNLDPGEDSATETLARMSKDEVFDLVLEWNGIIGYKRSIKSWVEGVYGVKLDSTELAK